MAINIATVLWHPNKNSHSFSRCYDKTWAEKLYRGFKRNLTIPFEFHIWSDHTNKFDEPIIQHPFKRGGMIDYGHCVEPFMLEGPMIFCGLDTIICGNIDKMAIWCLEHPGQMALPKHPYEPQSINGVVLRGAGMPEIYRDWNGENDMDWMREFPHKRIDELWNGRVVSYKASVAKQGLSPKVRIVYFHGNPKPNILTHLPWVKEYWR